MDFSRLGSAQEPDNRRRNGRVNLQEVTCSLGQVLDLSSSGMRVQTKVQPTLKAGQIFGTILETFAGPLQIAAEVAWVRQAGWRKHQIGIRFVDPSPELRRAINELARSVASNEVVRPDIEAFRRNAG